MLPPPSDTLTEIPGASIREQILLRFFQDLGSLEGRRGFLQITARSDFQRVTLVTVRGVEWRYSLLCLTYGQMLR